MMLQEKKTYVAFVLDRSGSMGTIRESIVNGINEQVDIIKANAAKGGDTLVSLVTFTTGSSSALVDDWNTSLIETVFFNQPADKLKHLTLKDYQPNGGTPMYDGVGHTLDMLSDLDTTSDEVAFLVIVVSDGYENSSRNYTARDIATRVKQLEATGRWTFSYLGANQNLKVVQEQTGFAGVAYVANAAGTQSLFRGASAANTAYFDLREEGCTMDMNYSKTLADNMSEENSESK